MTVTISRTAAQVDRIQALVEHVDITAREMDTKWGVGRLRLLVPPDLRERWDRQAVAWDHAIWHGDPHEVDALSAAMIRGYRVLDAAALEAGQAPLSPVVWEVALGDGKVAAMVQTPQDAHAIAISGRYLEIWTLDEVARLIAAFPEIAQAKQIFPGARVQAARRSDLDWKTGDPIQDIFA